MQRMTRLKCPYCEDRVFKESQITKHLKEMHPNSPPLSTETISEMFAEYNLERQTRVETRKNKKKKIKNLFEKAYIEKNEESLANLLNLMKRDRSVRRYVTSRLSKAEKDVRIEYKVTNINKPWQGGAPGIGKRS